MKRFFLSLLLGIIFLVPTTAVAQSVDEINTDIPDVETTEVKAKVIEILAESEEDGFAQMVFIAEDEDGIQYTIDTSAAFVEGLRYKIKVGTKVYIQRIEVDGELADAFLVNVVRSWSLIWIVILFSILIVAIGYWRGATSLLGLGITLVVLFGFLLPAILKGGDPVLLTVIASIVILGVNMHVAHGFSKETLYAYGSTVVGLMFVLIFSKLFVAWTNLSGIASEEVALLYYQAEGISVPVGLLLAGIILGAVGVLDDIAITQTEVVAELRKANPDLSKKELFVRAMRVGRHHIASTVNTLVLAYAGAALPILLLFMTTHAIDTVRFINEEMVTEEIVRTLAGTSALVLTVPIATWFATFVKKR